MTRQAARKVIDGLEQRGYARTQRDAQDTRVLNVILTGAGTAYGQAITEVIQTLNREFSQRVDPGQLVAADAVLSAVITGDSALQTIALRIRPPQ